MPQAAATRSTSIPGASTSACAADQNSWPVAQ
jgi:hypothetical protein